MENTAIKKPECNSCMTYQKSTEFLISYLELAKDASNKLPSQHAQIIIVTHGACRLALPDHSVIKLDKNQMVALPPKTSLVVHATDDLSLVAFTLSMETAYFEHFTTEVWDKIIAANTNPSKPLRYLTLNNCIKGYLTQLKNYLSGRHFACAHYMKIKQMELLHYLEQLYSLEELIDLLSPIMTKDFVFVQRALKYYNQVDEVDHLAVLLQCSQAEFKRQFARIFGTSPYRWVFNKKAELVYRALVCSRKSFTQLAKDLGFSSPSHFNNFCQQMFDASPGDIRKGRPVEIK